MMKNLFTLLVFTILLNPAFSQTEMSKKEILEDLHLFFKTGMSKELWIDFNDCDLNELTLYQGNTAYYFKLSSIEFVEIQKVEKKKKTIKKLVLTTYPAAKIKSESGTSNSSLVVNGLGLVDSGNGIGYKNSINIYGDANDLEVFKIKLQNLINTKSKLN